MCHVCISTVMLTALVKKFVTPTEIIKQTKQDKMKTETLEPKTNASEANPKVVSEAEWLVARRIC